MLLSHAIEKALRKPAPTSIPLSGERALKNDYFAAFLAFPSLEWTFLVKSKELKGYSGILWENELEGRDATILKVTLNDLKPQLLVDHYFRGNQFNYDGAVWFLLGTALGRHRIAILKDQFSQQLYNRHQLIRSERIDVLRLLTEKTIQKPESVFHPLLLGAELHSRRWFFHPGYKEHEAHLRMIFESLVDTDDLKNNGANYSVLPHALVTLSEYERDEQKHQDNVKTARIGNKLTVAIVVIGIIGIVSQLFIWWHSPCG